MDKIGVAIIGCGTIAKTAHIPSYIQLPEVEIKYFCDVISKRAEMMVKQHGCGKAITDYHEILNDDEVQAVSVCTTNHMHMQISIDCLKAGKHVLCEKPAARTYQEALEMQKVQKATGKTLNIGVNNRFNTAVNRIKELIEKNELGEVYHIYGSFRAYRSIPGLGGDFTRTAIAGGGALIDWGVHFLDLIMYCTGDPLPKTVTGQTYSKLGVNLKEYVYTDMWSGPPDYDGIYDVEDFITGMIRTEGPTITLNGAWAQNVGIREMYVDFLGDKAGIRLQYGGNFTIYTAKDGALIEIQSQFKMEDMYLNEIKSFIRCCVTNEKNPSHIDTVIKTAHIMQALYDSSAQCREISLA